MIATLLTAIAGKYGLKRRGNSSRYVGPCPKCGGSSGSDKFVIKSDGGFKCYACSFKGDIITWLREMDGLSCPEAHEAAGLECRAHSCQVRGTCRQGDGSGKRPAKVQHSVAPQDKEAVAELPVSEVKTPQQSWQTWAAGLVEKAAGNLQEQPEVLAWLAARGIAAAAVLRFRLGWLKHQQSIDRKSFSGLEPEKDGKSSLWIPDGLVVPVFTAAGEIHRIRIRRTEEARAKFLPKRKYQFIEGGGTGPLVIRSDSTKGRCRGAMIVEADLDAMAVAAAHEQVMAIAIQTVSAGIPADLAEELATTPTILVCLDADPGKDGKLGAGPTAVQRWLDRYRQASFWPVPQGKDPGDYATAGKPLRPWIESGLIPEIKSGPGAVSAHDFAFIPGSSSNGGRGKKNSSFENNQDTKEPQTWPEPKPGLVHYIVTLLDGREIHVTNDKSLWSRLNLEGEIAFSENELKRLQLACGAMTKEERANAALQAVDVKQAFAGAYIQRGEMMA